jgi:D-alanyl-D-alanine carboxypeptidase/D-alanyl-D-alanine-endopeptidase (penicillin-binding protein 4)
MSGCAKATVAIAPAAPLTGLQQLSQDITAATMAPGVQRAAWGIVVHSVDRNERIFELNPRTLLVPASTTKLISVASAAAAVGWDFTFETSVRATAPIVDGTLRGDLLIVGSGDPSIDGRALSGWIDALKALGLRRIDGRVIGDDDAVEATRSGTPAARRRTIRGLWISIRDPSGRPTTWRGSSPRTGICPRP